MRPLIRLDSKANYAPASDKSFDLYLFKKDESLYFDLVERAENIMDQEYKDFLKKYPEPLSSKEELEEKMNKAMNDKDTMVKLWVPQHFVDQKDNEIAENARKISIGDYLCTGPEYDYREKFDREYEKWSENRYQKVKSLIFDYNERTFYEWYFGYFHDADFTHWISLITKEDK